MSTNVIINMKTTVHKKSSGQAPCFPDVCKTPTPAGPTPIPYPNLSQSTTSGKTTKKVKIDKKGAAVDGTKFSVSTGDEAGTAGGSVISNKIKGPSYFQNFSMDVKLERKKVARLADPKMNNCGSSGSPQPGEAQPPAMGGRHGDAEACKALEEKRIKQEDRAEEFRKHGIHPEHGEAISEACKETGKSATVRQGNPDCLAKIEQGFNGKPATCGGDSLSATKNGKPVTGMPPECVGLVGKVNDDGEFQGVDTASGFIPRSELDAMRAADPAGFNDNLKKRGAFTGDYDLHDVFDGRGRVSDHSRHNGKPKATYNGEQSFINAVNDNIAATDPNRSTSNKSQNMVQHGPQANFKEYLDKTGNYEKKKELWKDNPGKLERVLAPDPSRQPPKPLLHFDSNGEVYKIETQEDLDNLYKCKGASKPAHW